jgi:SAM-dependent methyltransferase
VATSATELTGFVDEDWDLVFATYALQYVEPLSACLAECRRVLRPGGRLVFALDHPMRDCFVDADDQEMVIYPVRDYFDQRPMQWRFDAALTPMRNAHYPISTWHDLLVAAGFQLTRLVEPRTPSAILDAGRRSPPS